MRKVVSAGSASAEGILYVAVGNEGDPALFAAAEKHDALRLTIEPGSEQDSYRGALFLPRVDERYFKIVRWSVVS